MDQYGKIFDVEGISYSEFRTLVDVLLAKGATTGAEQTDALVNYTRMNVQRMNRLDKTVVLSETLVNALAGLHGKFKLLVISEGWCGDAAQIMPVVNKMVMAAADKLSMRFILRDKHPGIMDQHLTNGGRAIPIILVLDAVNGGLIAKWGPRPAVLQNMLADWRQELNDKEKVAERLHNWYAKDKTQAIQEEMAALIKGLEIKA